MTPPDTPITTLDTLNFETLSLANLFFDILIIYLGDNYNNEYVERTQTYKNFMNFLYEFDNLRCGFDKKIKIDCTLKIVNFLEANRLILQPNIRHNGYIENHWYDIVSNGSQEEDAMCFILKTFSRVQRHVMYDIVKRIFISIQSPKEYVVSINKIDSFSKKYENLIQPLKSDQATSNMSTQAEIDALYNHAPHRRIS